MGTPLVISQQLDPHVDFVIDQLNARRIPIVRFNTDELPLQSSIELSFESTFDGIITTASRRIELSQIGTIWYRRPDAICLDTISNPAERETAKEEWDRFVQGTWEALYDHLWISQPANIKRAGAKALQLRVAANLGMRIPRTLITNDPQAVRHFWEECAGRVICKPFGTALMRDEQQVRLTYASRLPRALLDNEAAIRLGPMIYQEEIDKSLELRITVMGDQVFPCALYSQESKSGQIDWRREDVHQLKHTIWDLDESLREFCLTYLAEMGLTSGMFDLAITPAGEPVFFECNPNGQWVWVEQRVPQLQISKALIEMLTS